MAAFRRPRALRNGVPSFASITSDPVGRVSSLLLSSARTSHPGMRPTCERIRQIKGKRVTESQRPIKIKEKNKFSEIVGLRPTRDA